MGEMVESMLKQAMVALMTQDRAVAAERKASANFEQARQAVDQCFGVAKDEAETI